MLQLQGASRNDATASLEANIVQGIDGIHQLVMASCNAPPDGFLQASDVAR